LQTSGMTLAPWLVAALGACGGVAIGLRRGAAVALGLLLLLASGALAVGAPTLVPTDDLGLLGTSMLLLGTAAAVGAPLAGLRVVGRLTAQGIRADPGAPGPSSLRQLPTFLALALLGAGGGLHALVALWMAAAGRDPMPPPRAAELLEPATQALTLALALVVPLLALGAAAAALASWAQAIVRGRPDEAPSLAGRVASVVVCGGVALWVSLDLAGAEQLIDLGRRALVLTLGPGF